MEIARFRRCRRPPWSDTSGSASAGSNSARQFNRMVCMLARGRSREGQTAPNIPSNKGLHPPAAPVQSPNSSIQASQRLRCSQQVAASDRPFRVGILKPPIPGRAKRSSLRQLAVSRILAQSPFLNQFGRRITPQAIRVGPGTPGTA